MTELKPGDLLAKPAYGRIYPSVKDLKQGWDWGQDFKIIDGPYFSKRDLDLLKKDYTGLVIVCPLNRLRIRIFQSQKQMIVLTFCKSLQLCGKMSIIKTYVEDYLIYDIYYVEEFDRYLAYDLETSEKCVATSKSLPILRDQLEDLWQLSS